MSKFIERAATAFLILLTGMTTAFPAQHILFRKSLTAADRHCLIDMLRSGSWHVSPQLHPKMIAAAVLARVHLKGNSEKQRIFVIDESGFCGTAGCSMLIGEAGEDGICREIYSGSGFHEILTSSGFKPGMTVLRKRDHSYRRLYTPCELRFDGRQYQQIHDECPNINVQR